MDKTIKEQVLEYILQHIGGDLNAEHFIISSVGGDFHREEVKEALKELVEEGKIGVVPKAYSIPYKLLAEMKGQRK